MRSHHRIAMLVPDVHAPYHHRPSWGLVNRVAKLIQPDVLIDLGDLPDNYDVSTHLKEVDHPYTIDQELESANECLDDMDSWRAKEKFYFEGNHETRLRRYILENAKKVANLVPRIEDILRLKKRRWNFTPYGKYGKVGKLHLTHCINGRAGVNAHRDALARFQHNVVIGHTHRMAVAYAGNATSESHVGAMLGWLGDVDWIDYNHQIDARANWQLGFGVGLIEPNGTFHLQAVPIVKGKAFVFGSLVS